MARPVSPSTSQERDSEGGAPAIMRRSAVLMLGFLLSRLLGLVREVVIGAQYGTSAEYDAYVVAFRIPDTLFLLVMSGAFGSAFLPIFVGFWSTDRQAQAWRLANAVITLAVGVFLLLALFCLVATPWLVGILAPGLQGDRLELTVNLTRLLLLSPLLLGLGAAAMGILNARQRFAAPAFAPVAYNLGIIGGAVLLHDRLGIYGLALGVVIGAAAHFLLQVPELWRAGLRYRPVLGGAVAGLPEMAKLLGPRILGQAAFQVNFLILTNLASTLPEGRLSALNYGYLLATLPHGIFAMSLATVIFPTLAAQYGRHDLERLRTTIQQALGLLFFLTLPAAVGLWLLRLPLVQVLLQWRAFSGGSTALVAEALGWFALGLMGMAIVEGVTRAFYAMHDTTTPVVAGLVAIVVNFGASLLLIDRLGHAGLALALSLASLAEMSVLLIILRRRLGPLGSGLFGSVGRTLLGTAVMALLLWPAAGPLAVVTNPSGGRSPGQILWLISAIAWGGLAFLLVARATGSAEWLSLRGLVARRVGR